MSEPVSSEEIENVLSSIRRLVSSDEKPLTKPESTLVLTPALRVNGPVEATENIDEGAGSQEATIEFHHSKTEVVAKPDADKAAATSSLESTIAELEAVVGQQGGEWEPDGSNFEEDTGAKTDMSESAKTQAESTDNGAEVAAKPGASPKAKTKTVAKAEVVTKTDTAPADLADDNKPMIDAETLKAMVADLMREELKGALGTKITRDVRKVVRQEVKLALKNQSGK